MTTVTAVPLQPVKRGYLIWLWLGILLACVSAYALARQGDPTLVREQRWSPEGLPTSDDSYYLNGQPKSKSVYGGADTQRTVEVAEFYDSGQRASQGRFKTGLRGGSTTALGTHQSFDEKGRLAAETSYDDKGRTTRERVFDENGQLQRDDEVFEDGSRKAFAK